MLLLEKQVHRQLRASKTSEGRKPRAVYSRRKAAQWVTALTAKLDDLSLLLRPTHLVERNDSYPLSSDLYLVSAVCTCPSPHTHILTNNKQESYLLTG